jgi:hypothetical protein
MPIAPAAPATNTLMGPPSVGIDTRQTFAVGRGARTGDIAGFAFEHRFFHRCGLLFPQM